MDIGFAQEYKMSRLLEALHVTGKGYADYFVSISDSQNTEVYDLEVDSEDHTYYLWDCLTHNSTQLRQEVTSELHLEDIRISIDSSDIPHMHWQRGLTEGRIKQIKDDYLEREVREAIHDWKRHRVLKATKSSDDVLQANVGAFFLSDTEGKNNGTLEGLYGERTNLVGGKSIDKVLAACGYTQYI